MDRKNYDIFSPIKNSDEEKEIQLSDSFSKFLIGPDAFRNTSETGSCSNEKSSLSGAAVGGSEASGFKEIKRAHSPPLLSQHSLLSQLHSVESSVQSGASVASEASGSKEVKKSYDPSSSQCSLLSQGNISEKALSIKSVSSEKSCQIHRDKSTKSKAKKAEILSLPSSILEDPLFTYSEPSSSLKKNDNTKNLQLGFIKKSGNFSDTSLPANYDKQIKDQQNEAQCKTERKHTSDTNILQQHSIKKSFQANAASISKVSASKEIKSTKCPTSMSECDPSSQLFSVKSSVQSDTTVASEASRSEENKKNLSPSSVNQHNPLSEIQSRIEKMVSDAVESQVDNLQQTAHSHFHSLFKALHETKETAEHRHASERETLCKIMEELAEENRQLRNAASGHK